MSSNEQNESNCPKMYPQHYSIRARGYPKHSNSDVFLKKGKQPLKGKISKFDFNMIHRRIDSYVRAKFGENL